MTRHEAEMEYVGKVRAGVGGQTTALLDQTRRWAEEFGSKVILGDLTGDELSRLCDEEIAARYVLGEEA